MPPLKKCFLKGCSELLWASRSLDLWILMGSLEVRHRYHRSKIGTFWITLSMAVLVGTISIVWAYIFNVSVKDYLPHLTVGMIVWGYISTTLNESCTIYPSNAGYLKQVRSPHLLFIFQLLFRNILVLAHNYIILIAVLLIYADTSILGFGISLLSLLLVTINLFWMCGVVGLLTSRYRDLYQMVGALLQIIFYITPIVFKTDHMSETVRTMFSLNPFFHAINSIRAPLLKNEFPLNSLVLLALSAVFGMALTMIIYGKYSKRISYWV